MEKKKARRVMVASVTLIQLLNPVERRVKKGSILRHLFGRRVREISEQREGETLVLIGEVMHFALFQK